MEKLREIRSNVVKNVCFLSIAVFCLVFLRASTVSAQTPAYSVADGWCEQGNKTVATGAVSSTTKVQASYPKCTVTVYDTGTTNLSTIYSDSSGTPKSNPFTADSRGYWNFYAVDGTYDTQFSGGGPPTVGTPFTTGGHTTITYRKQGGTGAVDRNFGDKIYETVSVKDFGAKCDGSTDDLAAFNAAQDYLLDSGGGDLLVSGRNGNAGPGGNGTPCVISDTFQLGRGVHLRGESRYASIIKAADDFPINTPVIQVGPPGSSPGLYGSMISDLSIDANSISGSTGIYATQMQEGTALYRLNIVNFSDAGIDLSGSGVQNCYMNDLSTRPTATPVDGTGVRLTSVLSRVMVENISVVTSGSVYSTPGIDVVGCYGVTIRNAHLERYETGVLFNGGGNYLAEQIFGHSSITALVKYENNASGLAMNLDPNSATYTLDDQVASPAQQLTGILNFYVSGTHRVPILFVQQGVTLGDGTYDGILDVLGDNSKINLANSSFVIEKGTETNDFPTFRHAGTRGIVVQGYQNTIGVASGGLFLHGNGENTTGQPDRGEVAAGATSDTSTYTARGTDPAGITFTGTTSGTRNGMKFWADTGETPGSTFTPTVRFRVGQDGVQIYPRTTDPGCTASTDAGKFWFDTTTTTTVVKVCVNTAGTWGWKYLTLN